MDVLLRTRLPLKGLAISTSEPHSPARRDQAQYQPQTVCIAVRKDLIKKRPGVPVPPHSFRVAVRLLTQQINDTRRNRATTHGVVTASGTIAATGPRRLPPAPPALVLNLSPRIARNSYQQHTSSVPRGNSLRQSCRNPETLRAGINCRVRLSCRVRRRLDVAAITASYQIALLVNKPEPTRPENSGHMTALLQACWRGRSQD
jgi:hypothetical protein